MSATLLAALASNWTGFASSRNPFGYHPSADIIFSP